MILLCGEGLVLLLGLVILVMGPTQFFGRYLYGWRQNLIGIVLVAQAPLAIAMGGIVLGSTPPGPINGADPVMARDRLLSVMVEWAILLGALLISNGLAWTGPKHPQPPPIIVDEDDEGNAAKAP